MTGTQHAFGYAGFRESDDLRAALSDRVDVVADIRLVPLRRDSTWSRRTPQTVEGAGYEYIHVSGLGNLNYKAGGPLKLADPAETPRGTPGADHRPLRVGRHHPRT